MDNFLIYGVFLFAIISYPIFFASTFKKQREEQEQRRRERMERDAKRERGED